ncbi:MBOAT family O-acyltransferase [Desulfobaculum sp. SPO524]|uniref:MBOAT family O-acyltransferase n=1 Tax=Desulfobaculum sp. SPO524 TaxID=3378071 RepID=UPI0038553BD2
MDIDKYILRGVVLFTTQVYAILLLVTFTLHALARSARVQNVVLLCASLFFYSFINIHFLPVLVFTFVSSYLCSCLIRTYTRFKYSIAWIGIGVLVMNLAYFKYASFFLENINLILDLKKTGVSSEIVLPVGISFFTFQAISYIVDVLRGKCSYRGFVDYALYISFFPQLVAGPIERANNIFPQISVRRNVLAQNIQSGLYILTIGYFLKICIADYCGIIVDAAFNHKLYTGWTTVLATVLFSIQIYCDFWAYSLIAKGSAKLFGIDLVWNFNAPYAATSIVDFWRRWHISLSLWLRDYLYIPLGGSREGAGRAVVNIIATFTLCGLWHGAGWNFVVWGVYNGFLVAIVHIMRSIKKLNIFRTGDWLGWVLTTLAVQFGWFLFRVRSLEQLMNCFNSFSNMSWLTGHTMMLKVAVLFLFVIAVVELIQKRIIEYDGLFVFQSIRRAAITAIMVTLCFALYEKEFGQAFIYYNF